MCGYSSNTPSGNTQGIRSNHEDKTDYVFPPFNLPRRTQAIPQRSRLSLIVIFWSKIQCRGSRRQTEYSRAKYVALPVVYSSDSLSGNTQGICDNHEDRTDCVFPPFNLLPQNSGNTQKVSSQFQFHILE